MIIERQFNSHKGAEAKAFAEQCRQIRGLYVQEYYRKSRRYAVRVSGDALTAELAEKLLDGNKNYSTSAI